jgi:hypothetical protein
MVLLVSYFIYFCALQIRESLITRALYYQNLPLDSFSHTLSAFVRFKDASTFVSILSGKLRTEKDEKLERRRGKMSNSISRL